MKTDEYKKKIANDAGVSLNAWGQDAKTAKAERKRLSMARKMKTFMKHSKKQ